MFILCQEHAHEFHCRLIHQKIHVNNSSESETNSFESWTHSSRWFITRHVKCLQLQTSGLFAQQICLQLQKTETNI